MTLRKRAVAYRALKQPADALRDLTRALEVAPRDVMLWIIRAEIKVEAGRAADALTDLERAVSLEPTTVTHWRPIGVLRFKAGDAAGARFALDRAVALAKTPAERAEAHLYRGILRSKRRRFEEALADLKIALELEPNLQLAWASRISIRMEQGRLDQALAEANRLVTTVAPKLADAWDLRAQVHRRRGDRRAAIRDLDRALELDPRNIVALNRRAGNKEALGDHTGAMADYRRLGVLLGPQAVSQQAQIREKLLKLERLRDGGR